MVEVLWLDKEGRQLRRISHSEHQFKSLGGVAVDSEDNIYFTDLGTNQTFKLNMNYSKVQEYKVQQVKSPGHVGAAVVGGEVMVTECGNGSRIMVYGRELKYVRQIVGADKSLFYLLSSDSHQNVYDSDPGNSSVQVFNNDGEFQHSLGCDENGVAKLKAPWGIYVAGQNVYVADDVHMIVVFTTEGDYVTSFGRWRYCDVSVGKDGFVYAIDDIYNKVIIY